MSIFYNRVKYDGKNIILITDTNRNIWLSARQIGDILGYSSIEELKDKLKMRHYSYFDRIFDTGVGPKMFINDAGLYYLLDKTSDKEDFKKWVDEYLSPIIEQFRNYVSDVEYMKQVFSIYDVLKDYKWKAYLI